MAAIEQVVPEANEVQRGLAGMQLFRGLAREGLERIEAISGEERYKEGDFVFREGDMGDKLYLILEGRANRSGGDGENGSGQESAVA